MVSKSTNMCLEVFKYLFRVCFAALFEVRNNQTLAIVGGDVDPSHMDASFVLSNCSWTMAELVRVDHKLSTKDAQQVVDRFVDRSDTSHLRRNNVRRVLDVTMSLRGASSGAARNIDWKDQGR